MHLQTTKIQFPNIKLFSHDARKLRGYFGNLFREYSPLLHNHYETGGFRYKYPLVQYKVIKGVPVLIALEEGAELLTSLFLKINALDIGGTKYELLNKNIEHRVEAVGYSHDLHEYHFETIWIALNQNNFELYNKQNRGEKEQLLKNILVGNMLSFFKGINIHLDADERVMVKLATKEKQTVFKGQKMQGFEGKFVTNVQLPPLIGLGKAVSRGFGTIIPAR